MKYYIKDRDTGFRVKKNYKDWLGTTAIPVTENYSEAFFLEHTVEIEQVLERLRYLYRNSPLCIEGLEIETVL